MFYLLAAALCFAVIFIMLAGTSLISAGMFWASRRTLAKLSPRSSADLLFALRVLPLFLTVLVTLGFALPSFLRFEPHATKEIMGFRLLALAVCGGIALGGIVLRCWRVMRATNRAQSQWRSHSQPVRPEGVQIPVYRAEGACPLLAVTGVFRPEIFVANSVAENLSANELSAAIAHELAHVSSRDNLKQMLLKVTQPPQWFNLFRQTDAAWLNATEIAADESALASGASALDLSSALVKVGRLGQHVRTGEIAASHLLPETTESCIAMRVLHLQRLLQSERQPVRHFDDRRTIHWHIATLALLVISYAVCVNAVLPWVHEALEFLVR